MDAQVDGPAEDSNGDDDDDDDDFEPGSGSGRSQAPYYIHCAHFLAAFGLDPATAIRLGGDKRADLPDISRGGIPTLGWTFRPEQEAELSTVARRRRGDLLLLDGNQGAGGRKRAREGDDEGDDDDLDASRDPFIPHPCKREAL